jgi:AcrR family transcriptional regulator
MVKQNGKARVRRRGVAPVARPAPAHRAGPKAVPIPDRADRLLDAIEDIFLESGFATLTVGDLASRLRCSRRTIYELAPSKNDLVLAVLRRFFATLRTQARDLLNSDVDPARRLFEYMQVGVGYAVRMSPVFVADIDRWPPAAKVWQEHIRLRVSVLRELVQSGVDSGVFRGVHAHLVAEIIFASWLRIREPGFYLRETITIADAFDELARLLLHGLMHREDPPPNRRRARSTAAAKLSRHSSSPGR